MLKLYPIEPGQAVTVVRPLDHVSFIDQFPQLHPRLDHVHLMKRMHENIAKRFEAGAECIEVYILERPAWRYWADGRIEDISALCPGA